MSRMKRPPTPEETPILQEQQPINHAQMTALCESFHVLKGKPGTSPWNQFKFAEWASLGHNSSAVRQAAAFVLNVWNGPTYNEKPWWCSKTYRVGRFDVTLAFGLWDERNKEAFIQWCNDPFWP